MFSAINFDRVERDEYLETVIYASINWKCYRGDYQHLQEGFFSTTKVNVRTLYFTNPESHSSFIPIRSISHWKCTVRAFHVAVWYGMARHGTVQMKENRGNIEEKQFYLI